MAHALLHTLTAMIAPILIADDKPAQHARDAASEAMAAAEPDNPLKLLAAGRATVFTVAAIDNVRASMPDHLSPSVKIRLRSNANALGRSAQSAAATLRPAETPAAPAKTSPSPAPDSGGLKAWAEVMTQEAERLRRRAPDVSDEQRAADKAWVDVLTGVASGLKTRPAASARSALLAGTALGSVFPGLPPAAPHPSPQSLPQPFPQPFPPGG